jgi:integrase
MSGTSSRDDAGRADRDRPALYDPDRVRGLVARWIFSTPHLSRSAIQNRVQVRHLPDLTLTACHGWIVSPKLDGTPASNNYVRDRVSSLKAFLEWLEAEGEIGPELAKRIDWKHFRSEYPRIYGRQQAPSEARFLTYDQAYEQLLTACQDGTWIGSRDQLAIRFGLLGLRRREIVGLTWGNYSDGVIRTTGKKHRIREVRPGPKLTAMLATWRRQYEKALGRPLRPSDPLLCGNDRGYFRAACGTPSGYNAHLRNDQPACHACREANAEYQRQYRAGNIVRPHVVARKPAPAIAWGEPLGYTALYDLLADRSERAGLGHVAPHDLRRTTASILHNDRTADGGHRYDLLDIQKVMDHASPDTTQRSYLDRLDTAVKTEAGTTLD